MLKAVAPWFIRESYDNGITRIVEPHVHPLLRASIWHIRGERDLWIDAGTGIASLPTAFPELCEHDPLLVLTHAHVDHAGGADAFDQVFMHAFELDALPTVSSMPLDAATVVKRLGIGREPLGEELPEMLVDAVPPGPEVQAISGAGPTTPMRTIVEGDQIDLGDRTFTVRELPGHTPGSIGLHCRESRILVTGDALYEGTLIDDLPTSDGVAYAQTMRTILSLDIDLVLPGHGPPLAGMKAKVIAQRYLDTRPHSGE
ncbi:MBL fold metallo-hydrolase [Saxibacter everestensis]|uniref:MBL fold metallo-hydrolase n=1 Tax=Saxibacter everestensis TaxID=2909229 RepID=A0ABY8QYT8_9MICO|nr:MBL fold metallo-hydrolase [Brevibacteriaceae bacterium ZFBP1038]